MVAIRSISSKQLRWSQNLFAYLLNAPSILVILGLVGYPLVYAFWLSLHNYDLTKPQATRFVGLQNYVQMLQLREFWHSLRLTLQFTFGVVTLTVVGGLLIALLLNESFKGRGILRAVALIPWAMPPVVSGTMWKWILDSRVGFVNALLSELGVIETYKGWLVDKNLVMGSMIFVSVWQSIPLAAILLLAGLQAIPVDLYDAAKVDRAGPWQRFRHVTLPWLLQPLLIVVIVRTTFALRAFDVVWTLTFGGPGDATTFLSWRTYQTAFRYLNFGLGSTYAFWLALLSMVMAILYFSLLRGGARIEV